MKEHGQDTSLAVRAGQLEASVSEPLLEQAHEQASEPTQDSALREERQEPPVPVPTGPYAFEDVLANFRALLHDVDFSRELALLGVRRFDFMGRRRMQLELRACYAGLWFLALRRSFPETAQHIFELFLKQHAAKRTGKRETLFRERAAQYRDMLAAHGDQDFTTVSRHLLSFTQTEEGALKALSLRLALNLRASYSFIFDRLL